jgi:hypothetical protein
MKLTSNTPGIFSRYQDISIKAPSVEDGNAPANDIKQGKIYTSEINAAAGYDVDYSAAITDVKSTVYTTGTNFIYDIDIQYVATFQSITATDPGFYGSNIFKAGEAFVIKGQANDWVRGYIANINEIIPTITSPTQITFDVKLACTVIQGDPMAISVNDKFLWKRQIYQDESTFNEAFVPVNLSATFDKVTQKGYFYWDDINQESRKYILSLRDTSSTGTPSPFLFNIYGKIGNPNTKIKVFNAGSTITTYKILDKGEPGNSIKQLVIKGSGTGEEVYTIRDTNGQLLTNEYTVYDAVVGANNIYVYSDTPIDYQGTVIYNSPVNGTYIDGLPSLGSATDYYVSGTSFPPGVPTTGRYLNLDLFDASTGLPIVITPAWRNSILNIKAVTHDGVYINNTGTGYTGKVIASEEIIPARTRWFYDPAIYGLLAPGTYAWTVCAIYDEINKLYTEWAPEEYITIL